MPAGSGYCGFGICETTNFSIWQCYGDMGNRNVQLLGTEKKVAYEKWKERTRQEDAAFRKKQLLTALHRGASSKTPWHMRTEVDSLIFGRDHDRSDNAADGWTAQLEARRAVERSAAADGFGDRGPTAAHLRSRDAGAAIFGHKLEGRAAGAPPQPGRPRPRSAFVWSQGYVRPRAREAEEEAGELLPPPPGSQHYTRPSSASSGSRPPSSAGTLSSAGSVAWPTPSSRGSSCSTRTFPSRPTSAKPEKMVAYQKTTPEYDAELARLKRKQVHLRERRAARAHPSPIA